MVKHILTAILLVSLFACSSNDKTTSEPQPNYDIAVGAIKTTATSLSSGDRPDIGIPSGLLGLQEANGNSLSSQLPVGAAEVIEESVVDGGCGGKMTTNGSVNYSGDDSSPFPATLDYSLIFDDYCEADSTVDGYVTINLNLQSATQGSYDMDMELAGVDILGNTQSFKFRLNCTITNSNKSCTEEALHLSDSGDEMRLANFLVTGDESSGFDVEGNFEIDGGNSYQLSAESLSRCENGYMGSGGLTLYSGSDLVMTIEFINCDEFTYTTNDGGSETISYNSL